MAAVTRQSFRVRLKVFGFLGCDHSELNKIKMRPIWFLLSLTLMEGCRGDVSLSISSLSYTTNGFLTDGTLCYVRQLAQGRARRDEASTCNLWFAVTTFVPTLGPITFTADDHVPFTGLKTIQPLLPLPTRFPLRPTYVEFSVYHIGPSINSSDPIPKCVKCFRPVDVFVIDLSNTYPTSGQGASAKPITQNGKYGSSLSFQFLLSCTDKDTMGANCDLRCQPMKNASYFSCTPANPPQPSNNQQNVTVATIVCMKNSATSQPENCTTCANGLDSAGNGCALVGCSTNFNSDTVSTAGSGDYKIAAIFFGVVTGLLIIVLIVIIVLWRRGRRTGSHRGSYRGPAESQATYAAPRSYSPNPHPGGRSIRPSSSAGRKDSDSEEDDPLESSRRGRPGEAGVVYAAPSVVSREADV